jgi:hypothetical protein
MFSGSYTFFWPDRSSKTRFLNDESALGAAFCLLHRNLVHMRERSRS